MMRCSVCVKRLPAHLKNVHEISPSTDEYKRLLKKALRKTKRPCSVLEVENRLKEEFHKDEALSKRKRPYLDLEVEEGADKDAAVVDSVEAEVEDEFNTNPFFILTFSKWVERKMAKLQSSMLHR